MLEYLLSVAEKIIDSSVPENIAIKYYELKKTLMIKTDIANLREKTRSEAFELRHRQTLKQFPFDVSFLKKQAKNYKINNQLQIPAQAKNLQRQRAISQNRSEEKPLKQVYLRESKENDEIPQADLFSDNKWLLEQVGKLLRENTILRKIVQRKK